MKRFLILLSLPVLLISCSSVRETLGVDKTAPDEFAVVERAPLTVPPDFTLNPPEPGAPRPQEARTTAQAQELVLGTGNTTPSANMSSAEKSLLSKVGSGTGDATIRQQLSGPDDDQGDSDTVAQKLGISSSDETGKALDPDAESQRLKKQNVKTPNVPTKPAAK